MKDTPGKKEKLPTADMQALVAFGFKDLPNGEYLLLTVGRSAAAVQAAKAWLRDLINPRHALVLSVDAVARRDADRRQRLATVAVSHAGLRALGLRPSDGLPFPSTFAAGMGQAEHARLLCDDAESWRWADCELPEGSTVGTQRQVVHLLVAHYWSKAVDGQPCPLLDRAELSAVFAEVQCVPADSSYFRREGTFEHFGFKDGISQPQIDGLRDDEERSFRDAEGPRRQALKRDRIAAGEFVLGQTNEYDEQSYAPDVDDYPKPARFAQAGSYLAVRQILQHTAAFEEFELCYARNNPPRPDGTTIGERMVGRKRKGTPLCPVNPGDESDNDFGYFATDIEGYGCPRGAHMRRSNPRDSLGHDVEDGESSARLHRLLRRGRTYRLGEEKGLFFMALNADLDRQFAFIQQRWTANPRFDGLASEGDPLLGQTQRAFTVQDRGLSQRVIGLPRFTTVVGGGYFLLPSMPALKYMAQAAMAAKAATAATEAAAAPASARA